MQPCIYKKGDEKNDSSTKPEETGFQQDSSSYLWQEGLDLSHMFASFIPIRNCTRDVKRQNKTKKDSLVLREKEEDICKTWELRCLALKL